MDNQFIPLTREQLKRVIEGKGAAGRIPMVYHFWSDAGRFGAEESRARELMAQYPCDVQALSINMPEVFQNREHTAYSWTQKQPPECVKKQGLDAIVAIEDWDELDEVLARFPSPDDPALLPPAPAPDGRYRLANWWYCLFERFWSLRGMENALMDFYLYPEQVHRLFEALTNFYCRTLERCKAELGADGVFTSDDIGSQTSPFFSNEIFDTFFKPYYSRILAKAHELGMHFWLHTCGNVEAFIPRFIDMGLDVLHPIQKYTMEERAIVEKFGGQICFWAGFDVQQTIPYGTPEDVRREVRFMIDTYDRPDGRFMLTCGNSLTEDCPIASFEALLDESYRYGVQKAQRRAGPPDVI